MPSGSLNLQILNARRRLLVLVIVVVIAGVGGFIGYTRFTRVSSWEMEVMVRIIQESAQIRKSGEDWVPAADLIRLSAGDSIRTGVDGKVVIQSFDGSDLMINGSTEVKIVTSRQAQRPRDVPNNQIAFRVVEGSVATHVAPLANRESYYQLLTANSVASVQGTRYEVEVDEEGNAAWHVSEGDVKLAAVTVSTEGDVQVYLVTLDEGSYAVVAPLPEELVLDETISTQVLEITALLSREAAKNGDTVAPKVKGTSVTAADENSGTAVFEITVARSIEVTDLQETPALPEGSEPIDDGTIAGNVTGLIHSYAEVVDIPDIPNLPNPDIWDVDPQDDPVVLSAPSYFYSITGIVDPLDVAVVGDRIFVTESGGERLIRAFDTQGNELFTMQAPGTINLSRIPAYITSVGNTLYVSDHLRNVIDIFNSDGGYIGKYHGPDLFSPSGILWHENTFYVIDREKGYHKLIVYDDALNILQKIGESGGLPGQFAYPSEIAVDEDYNIYVSDSNNLRVQMFAPNQKHLNDTGEMIYDQEPVLIGMGGGGSGTGLSRGLAIDLKRGILYSVDALGCRVTAWSLGGDNLKYFEFGSVGQGDGQFLYPNGIDVSENGRIYIADKSNNRVQVWGY